MENMEKISERKIMRLKELDQLSNNTEIYQLKLFIYMEHIRVQIV